MSLLSTPPRMRGYAVATLLLTGAADVLFFDTPGRTAGLSAPLFVALVALAGVACRCRRPGRNLWPHALLLGLALLALTEHVEARSLVLGGACLGGFALAAAGRLPPGLEGATALGRFLFTVPPALLVDVLARLKVRERARVRGRGARAPFRGWLAWIMPVGLALGFGLLLGTANPIIGGWIASLDPLVVLSAVDPVRIAFWLVVIALVWPFLRPRLRLRSRRSEPVEKAGAERDEARQAEPTLVFGPDAILRALVLVNAVFAAQTLLDAAYLWGGATLPEGLDYAAYAHRGSYTLMAAALLAASFVLLALPPGGAAEASRPIRALAYLWMAQNVALVLSAMLRLDLYVGVYALTHLRLAAFVWMGVVAAGLALVCVRIARRRSNRWLVRGNLLVLALVFAGSCFVDDDALIARFNVAHSREVSGYGAMLDVDHLVTLGPAAIPAIDDFLRRADRNVPAPFGIRGATAAELRDWRWLLAERHRRAQSDWRDWTFRGWRLTRYLEANPLPGLPMPSEQPLPPSEGTD